MEYTRLAEIDLKQHIGKRVFVTFMCKDVEIKEKKDGKSHYMCLTIADRQVEETGAKIFDLTDYHKTMVRAGCVYSAAIDVQKYEQSKNGYTLVIYNISMRGDDGRDYFNWADNINESANSIREIMGTINTPVYASIVQKIMASNWEKFIMYPAANSMHHSQLGGLCVHTNEVLTISLAIAQMLLYNKQIDELNLDLIKTAAILHDIAKVEEFTVDMRSGKSEYSEQAALTTHITLAVEYIDRECMLMNIGKYSSDGVGKREIELLKHCILSHHAKKEYGSPIEPSTIEAYIISRADTISADTYRFKQTLRDMQVGESKTTWSSGKIEIYYK